MRPTFLNPPYSRRRRYSFVEVIAAGVIGSAITAMFLLIVKGVTL